MSQKVEVEVGLRDRFSKDYESAAQRIERAVTLLEKQVRKTNDAGAKAATTGKQGADKATDAINKTGNATDALGRKLRQTGNEGSESFGKLQKAAAGFFTLAAAKEFGQKIFDVRSEIQSLQTSFETLVGNKPQAEELFSSIREFAVKTPMQMKDLASAAQTMMSFNIPVEQIMENLKALGDVSMGDAQKFQSLSLAFSQMSATGKLMGQDLLQMINAGFNPLATISEKTGKSIAQLKEEMEKGAISADMVRQAFIDATSEGGKFYDMLEAQSKTLRGAYSNLQGAIDDMFNSIGEQSEGIMAGAIDAATLLVQNYEKVGKAILFVVATYGEYKAAVMVNIALEKAQAFNRLASAKGLTAMQLATDILTKKTAALNAVLMANPYVLLAAAVMSAATAYVLFRNKTDEVSEAQKRLNDIKDEAAEKVEEEKDKIEELRRVAMSEQWTLAARQDAIKKLNALIPNYNAQLDATSGKYRENKAALDDYLVSLARKYELEGAKDQLRQIGKEIAQTRLEIAKAKENVAGTKSLQGNVGKMSAYNPAESQFLVANTSRAEKDLDDANKRLSVKLQERKLIYDTFGEEIVKDVVAGQGLDPMSNNPKGGGGKKGSTGVNKEDITAQQILLDRELEERRSQARIDAANAAREAYIASIQDNASREMAQEKFEHEKRIQEIGAQAVEMKKARYEAEKKQWELTNKGSYETGSDAGKAGWMGVSLSDDEMVLIQAQLEKENAEYNRAMQERSQSLIAAHQSYTDQKLAIDKTYNDEVARINEAIRQAEQRGDTEMVEALKRSLAEAAKERAKAQGELSLNILKESPEYVRAFEDLQQTSSETLELLISQFEEAKEAAAQSMEPKDLREFTDTLQQMYDELDSRDPFKAMQTSLMEVRDAHKQVIKAEADLRTIQNGGIVTVRVYDKELDRFVDTVVTEEDAMKKVAEAKDKEAKANTKYRKASKEAGEVIDDLAASIQNVGGVMGGMAGEIVSLVGDITSVVNGALHAMENTAQGASAAIQAAEKASAILAIISAALQVIQKISGLVKNLFGANDAKDYEKAKARYERLASIWDELIDKKREYMNESWGKEVMGAEEEARALLKIEEEQIRLLAKQRLDVKNGSHSMNYRMWQGSYKFNGQNWEDVAREISNALGGVQFGSMRDMVDMTSEQLQWIKEHYVGLWSVMDSDFRDHLEKIIQFGDTETEIIDNAMERLTGTRAEDVFNDFMDNLYELADGSEEVMDDIAENWQKMVNRMTINNLIGGQMKADLEEWYRQLAELNERRAGGGMTNEEYKQELDRLSALYDSYIENGRSQIEQFREMGIIKSIAKEEEEALEEVEEEVRGYLDSVRSSFQQLIGDTSIDIDKWSKDMRNTILRNLMESKLLDEAFDEWAQQWSDRYSSLLDEMTEGAIDQQMFDRQMQGLMYEFDQRTGEIADKSKQMWKAFGFDEETEEEVLEEAKGAFDDLHSSFLSTLTDISGDVEKWSKDITRKMVEQMVEKNILNDAFDGAMDDWRERFENALTAGDTAGLKALRQELYDLRGSLAEQARTYMEALGYVEDVAEEIAEEIEEAETPLDDLRSMFRSSLMDMKSDAEDLGKDIGRALTESFIEQFVLGEAFEQQVEYWKKEYSDIMGGNLSSEERAAQISLLKKTIADAREGYAEQARQILEMMGLDNTDYSDQQAHVNMADKATYDQFELFLGMQTAMMIGQEQGNAVRQQILSTLQAMAGITSPQNDYGSQIFMRLGTTNEYLLDIKKSNKDIFESFGTKLDSINQKLSRL